MPSNPGFAVGWRTRKDISFALGPVLEKKGVEFIHAMADQSSRNRIESSPQGRVPHDYTLIATGAETQFWRGTGLGPSGHTSRFAMWTIPSRRGEPTNILEGSRPHRRGGGTGASCFGPAYEMAFILDADLRQKKLRKKVPIYFVTPDRSSGIWDWPAWGLASIDGR